MIATGKIGLKSKVVFLGLLVPFFLFSNGCVKKTASGKVYRVGILSGLDFFADTADGFREKMAELGYIEGKNIVYDLQKTQFDPPAEQLALKKFIADKVDLILTFPTEVSLKAKAAAKDTKIPVVFANANIEGVDLVECVRHPGGSVTGVRYPGPDLAVKRLEILLELLPKAKKILIPYQRGYPIVASQLEALQPIANSFGLTFVEVPAANAAELQVELEARAGQLTDVDAVLFVAEPLAVTPDPFAVIGKFAAERNLLIGGALMSAGAYASVFGVSTNNLSVGRQAAVLADKILKGVSPCDIPVVSAENFIQINYQAAQKLGIEVNEGLLGRADEIIR